MWKWSLALKKTIEACFGDEAWWGEFSTIFADSVDLASLIGNVTFKHCSSEANKIAHDLARECFSNKVSYNGVDESSSLILCKILNNITIVAN